MKRLCIVLMLCVPAVLFAAVPVDDVSPMPKITLDFKPGHKIEIKPNETTVVTLQEIADITIDTVPQENTVLSFGSRYISGEAVIPKGWQGKTPLKLAFERDVFWEGSVVWEFGFLTQAMIYTARGRSWTESRTGNMLFVHLQVDTQSFPWVKGFCRQVLDKDSKIRNELEIEPAPWIRDFLRDVHPYNAYSTKDLIMSLSEDDLCYRLGGLFKSIGYPDAETFDLAANTQTAYFFGKQNPPGIFIVAPDITFYADRNFKQLDISRYLKIYGGGVLEQDLILKGYSNDFMAVLPLGWKPGDPILADIVKQGSDARFRVSLRPYLADGRTPYSPASVDSQVTVAGDLSLTGEPRNLITVSEAETHFPPNKGKMRGEFEVILDAITMSPVVFEVYVSADPGGRLSLDSRKVTFTPGNPRLKIPFRLNTDSPFYTPEECNMKIGLRSLENPSEPREAEITLRIPPELQALWEPQVSWVSPDSPRVLYANETLDIEFNVTVPSTAVQPDTAYGATVVSYGSEAIHLNDYRLFVVEDGEQENSSHGWLWMSIQQGKQVFHVHGEEKLQEKKILELQFAEWVNVVGPRAIKIELRPAAR